MVPFARHLISNWLLPALLIAVAQGVFAPASAEASCGDYVRVGVHSRSQAGMEARPAHDVELENRDASRSPVRQLPCSGPQCSGDAPRPFGVPAAPVKVVARHWGIVEASLMLTWLESRFACFDDDAGATRFALSSVYRPPR
jgi:hypothetical protein